MNFQTKCIWPQLLKYRSMFTVCKNAFSKILKCTCIEKSSARMHIDLAVRRLAADCHVLTRGSRVPQGHALYLSWGRYHGCDWSKQYASSLGLDGPMASLLFRRDWWRYRENKPENARVFNLCPRIWIFKSFKQILYMETVFSSQALERENKKIKKELSCIKKILRCDKN